LPVQSLTLSALAEALHRFDPPWLKVGRIYRRVCFLRSQGQGPEARRVEETELAAAAAETVGDSTPLEAGDRLQAFYSEERERVAEAIALVEVLVPTLSLQLSTAAPARLPAAPARAPLGAWRADPAKEHGIADFIDEMLAQDRAGPR
jgi:hypothetical protein